MQYGWLSREWTERNKNKDTNKKKAHKKIASSECMHYNPLFAIDHKAIPNSILHGITSSRAPTIYLNIVWIKWFDAKWILHQACCCYTFVSSSFFCFVFRMPCCIYVCMYNLYTYGWREDLTRTPKNYHTSHKVAFFFAYELAVAIDAQCIQHHSVAVNSAPRSSFHTIGRLAFPCSYTLNPNIYIYALNCFFNFLNVFRFLCDFWDLLVGVVVDIIIISHIHARAPSMLYESKWNQLLAMDCLNFVFHYCSLTLCLTVFHLYFAVHLFPSRIIYERATFSRNPCVCVCVFAASQSNCSTVVM